MYGVKLHIFIKLFLKISDYYTFTKHLDPVTTKDMQTHPPPPLRNSHLEIKDVQCAKAIMAVKFHITS